MQETALIPSADILVYLANYKSELEAIDAFVAIQEKMPSIRVRDIAGPLGEKVHTEQKDLREAAKRGAWYRLLKAANIQNLMDRDSYGDFLRQLERSAPDFTPETVHATVCGLLGQRKDFQQKTLKQILGSLSWDYKSNSPRLIGKRIVMQGMGESYDPQCFSFEATRILNQFHGLLAGLRRETETNPFFGLRYEMLVELPGFTVKRFKNRNGHIFLSQENQDLVNKHIASLFPNALPACVD